MEQSAEPGFFLEDTENQQLQANGEGDTLHQETNGDTQQNKTRPKSSMSSHLQTSSPPVI